MPTEQPAVICPGGGHPQASILETQAWAQHGASLVEVAHLALGARPNHLLRELLADDEERPQRAPAVSGTAELKFRKEEHRLLSKWLGIRGATAGLALDEQTPVEPQQPKARPSESRSLPSKTG